MTVLLSLEETLCHFVVVRSDNVFASGDGFDDLCAWGDDLAGQGNRNIHW